MGIPQAFADLVRVVPFNDLAEAERAFTENEGRVAGMIVEPAMMNCGVVCRSRATSRDCSTSATATARTSPSTR